MRLQNKVAVVTGAAQGNGHAIALAYAREGARVVIADIQLFKAEETVGEILAAGGRAIAVAVDVSRRDQVEQMVVRTLDEYGQIDVLVNNAGIADAHRFLEYPEEAWDRIINVNLKSVFLCGQAAARHMTEHGGSIINIASLSAERGFPRLAGYGPSKAAVKQLTKVMAIDLGRYKIRVNCIGPGNMITEMTEAFRASATINEQFLQRTPLGRWGEPEELTGAAIFLASEESSFITGTTVWVDGGYLCW
ncbi:MAG: SDR family oxidoreductase [Chloroflexota bacterium]|nr:MAG: SDR family oxidoreductase [Chloroflexota bacterium]